MSVTTDNLLEPFFTDERTIQQKLAATEREWRPQEPGHESPAIIAGLVIEVGEYYSSEYHDENGAPKISPTLRVLARDNVVWSVIGFHGYLREDIRRKQPKPGDFVALAFRGTVAARKKGFKDAFDFKVEVERNPDAVATEQNQRGNDALAGSDPVPTLPEG